MSWLIASDLHLTIKPEHEYRWRFMEWLADQANCDDVTAVLLLGDISDAKDFHSALMVNRTVTAISELTVFRRKPVHILFGNHDGPSQDRPFWKFLEQVQDVHYHTKLDVAHLPAKGRAVPCLMSPWGTEGAAIVELQHPEAIPVVFAFMHASVDGVTVENGTVLPGHVPNKFLPRGKKVKVWSGDIHLAQKIGDVEYVGAPYHCRFGDNFKGRVIKQDPHKPFEYEELHFDGSPSLHTLKVAATNASLPEYLKPGDRIKLTVQSDRPFLPGEWREHVKAVRAQCEERGVELVAAALERPVVKTDSYQAPSGRRSDEAIVRTYAQQQNYDPATTEIGVGLVKPA